MKSRILVVGASGLVGGALQKVYSEAGHDVLSTARQAPVREGWASLDMTSPPSRQGVLGSFHPDWVVIPAANPFVDYCELHPQETRAVNVEGTVALARDAARAGARCVFYSSDYVFDGVKGSYTEEDIPNPINEYGRQKAATESGLLAAGAGNLVLRTSGVYGWQAVPKNFVLQIREKLAAGQAMKVAADLRYNPTYAADLARATLLLTEKGAQGIYHAAGSGTIGRHEFAVLAAKAFGLDPAGLVPVSSSEFASPTPRPKSTVLLGDRLAAEVGPVMSGPEEGLTRMLADEAGWLAFRRRIC